MASGPEKMNRDRMLSTGQVAQLMSVTSDTVLKWIKSGRLRASRTAGGHYRIAQNDLDRLIDGGYETERAGDGDFLYCWEYYATDGEPGESCLECLVFRTRARRCYEMSDLGREVGYAGAYCTNTCDECSYYQEVVGRRRRVLIVSESAKLRHRLGRERSDTNIDLMFAASEYECSAACHDFKPEFVVIDGSLPKPMRASLCYHLAADPRLPGVQIIVANADDDQTATSRKDSGIGRAIPRTFGLAELEEHIIGLEVKQPTPA
jgi:excisionase family DNA binding protein